MGTVRYRPDGTGPTTGARLTPEAVGEFRSLFRLRDLAADDDQAPVFESLVSLAVWHYRERANPAASNDEILSSLHHRTALHMGLLMHLATVDQHCFRLARRMAARTVVRNEPLLPFYRRATAWLLTSDPPRQRKPLLVRDAVAVMAISVAQTLGLRPTEAEGSKAFGRSGCARFAAGLSERGVIVEYEALAKVWGQRFARLSAAGFKQDDQSEFFAAISPMT